jgi:cytochrome c6
MKLLILTILFPFAFQFFSNDITTEQVTFNGNKADTDTINIALGKKIYRKKCRFCHGKTGGRKTRKIPALKNTKLSLNQIITVVTNGRNNMGAYKNRLTKNEILNVAAYVQTLKQQE